MGAKRKKKKAFNTKKMRGSRGGQGVLTLSPKKIIKAIGFLSNICPDPLKNPKAAKQTFNVWPSMARQQNTI